MSVRPLVWLAAAPLVAASIRIENHTGNINIQVTTGAAVVEYRAVSTTRNLHSDDVRSTGSGDSLSVVCQPADGAPIDIQVTVPNTARVEAATKTGAISVSGLVAYAKLVTGTGDIRVAAPWEQVHLRVLSEAPPREVLKAKSPGVSFVVGKKEFLLDGKKKQYWALSNLLPMSRLPLLTEFLFTKGWYDDWGTFSAIDITGITPGRLELIEQPLPERSWLRAPADADAVLKDMHNRLAKGKGAANVALDQQPEVSKLPAGDFVFRSNVRLVNLMVTVWDQTGHPVAGIKPEDFELLENNKSQKLAFARSEKTPLNLVLLVDLSKSTILTRPVILDGARRFIQMMQPGDRLAVHVLANSLFQVISPLTDDRSQLLSLVENISGTAGGSPIYDSIVLSYAQEPLFREGERSAMLVLTDGMDNQFEGNGAGSRVPFDHLRSAVAEWPIPIYTILVPYDRPDERPAVQVQARKNMRQLADISGGRLFEAAKATDLNRVYAQVDQELRSVYSIGYYPENQNFDGSWRNIRLRLTESGVSLRTRPGYYAW